MRFALLRCCSRFLCTTFGWEAGSSTHVCEEQRLPALPQQRRQLCRFCPPSCFPLPVDKGIGAGNAAQGHPQGCGPRLGLRGQHRQPRRAICRRHQAGDWQDVVSPRKFDPHDHSVQHAERSLLFAGGSCREGAAAAGGRAAATPLRSSDAAGCNGGVSDTCAPTSSVKAQSAPPSRASTAASCATSRLVASSSCRLARLQEAAAIVRRSQGPTRLPSATASPLGLAVRNQGQDSLETEQAMPATAGFKSGGRWRPPQRFMSLLPRCIAMPCAMRCDAGARSHHACFGANGTLHPSMMARMPPALWPNPAPPTWSSSDGGWRAALHACPSTSSPATRQASADCRASAPAMVAVLGCAQAAPCAMHAMAQQLLLPMWRAARCLSAFCPGQLRQACSRGGTTRHPNSWGGLASECS